METNKDSEASLMIKKFWDDFAENYLHNLK